LTHFERKGTQAYEAVGVANDANFVL